MNEPIPCNLCGSKASTLLYPATLDERIDPDDFACTSSAYGQHGPIVKCSECGLIYLIPRTGSVLEQYENVVDNIYAEEEKGRVLTFTRAWEEIEKHVKSGRLLDLGSYTGVFMHVAKTTRTQNSKFKSQNFNSKVKSGDEGRGTGDELVAAKLDLLGVEGGNRGSERGRIFPSRKSPLNPPFNKGGSGGISWEVYGVEPSRWAAQYCREKFGIEVSGRTIEEANFPDGFFDLVTMHDTIEHIDDPKKTFLEAGRVLKSGGFLYITTINIGSTFARLLGSRWPWLMEMHLYYFDRKTITEMLRKSGFETVEIYAHRRTLTVRYLLGRLGKGALSRLVSGLAKAFRLYEKPVTVSLGDIMTVIARKQ